MSEDPRGLLRLICEIEDRPTVDADLRTRILRALRFCWNTHENERDDFRPPGWHDAPRPSVLPPSTVTIVEDL